MDTHSLAFPYSEHFAFESSDYLNIDDESQSTDAGHLGWEEWEVEQELNGDVALIPMSSEVGLSYLSTSPPGKDFHRIMSDWQAITNLEISSIDDIATGIILEDESPSPHYDLPTVKTEIPTPATQATSKPDKGFNVARSTGKRIDMEAQCYIIEGEPPDGSSDSENEQCDVGSVIDNLVHLKTEPIDIVKKEIPDIKTEVESDEVTEAEILCNIKEELDSSYGDLENDFIDVDTISNHGIPILEAGDVNSLLEQFEATESNYLKPISNLSEEDIFGPTNSPKPTETNNVTECQTNNIRKQANNIEKQANNIEEKQTNAAEIQTNNIVEKQTNETLSHSTNTEDDSSKNKQILNALPQELIQRIKASSKRKTVPVIDPIPTKKRGVKRPHPEQPLIPQEKDKAKEQSSSAYLVQLDHDYCSMVFPYPKHPKKDSGFESAEEDEQRNVLRNQPTVKGADGKLMVSLLKINTIKNNLNNDSAKKKKLNLEQYKKLRCIKSCDNSQNNSPNPSRPSSPVEDEKQRLIKHQQKLMQMAAEVLKTPPKSARKSVSLPQLENLPAAPQSSAPPTPVPSPAPTPAPAPAPTPPPPRVPPDNMVVKVIVSVGVNTESEEVPVDVPASEFKEIQPLLKKASTKISNNSLIASVLENIKNKKTLKPETPAFTPAAEVHGEDKTILYLNKNRPVVKTVSVEVQTDPPTAPTATKRSLTRRRIYSNSSEEYNLRRSGSSDSRYSYSSHSSYSSRSRSPSRSPSPRRYRKRFVDHDRERIREVEERRIVYVGGIDQNTTKDMLKRRFQRYGSISNVSVHFRQYGDNYGFVTFLYKIDAYNAVEHGNDDPTLPRYDLSFGGRRLFCRANYSDLDNVQDEIGYKSSQGDDSFDALLREAQAKLRKRKACT